VARDAKGMELRQCPRVHLKLIAVDGRALYLGSANFTGAGLGAKGDGRRNFEMGILTDDEVLLDASQARFDAIWRGKECGPCRLRSVCPKPLDSTDDASTTAQVRPMLPAWNRFAKIPSPSTTGRMTSSVRTRS